MRVGVHCIVGRCVAQVDPAIEIGMSHPTSGLLCVTGGPHIQRCNPSFIWSDDSCYLAVPQFHGFFGRQRVLVVAFGTFNQNRFRMDSLWLGSTRRPNQLA